MQVELRYSRTREKKYTARCTHDRAARARSWIDTVCSTIDEALLDTSVGYRSQDLICFERHPLVIFKRQVHKVRNTEGLRN
jgi:hypothetical protein